MGLMLLGLAALYKILGDRSDSVILLVAWVPVTAVDVILELRASSALKALRAHLSPLAKVLRGGQVREVAIREIVPGDILVFEEGQTLPADGRIVEAAHLTVGEAALTGESVPVEKEEGREFWSGTVILSGRGLGLVEKTGKQTRFGHIAGLLKSTAVPSSPLKKTVDRLVKRILIVALALAVVLLAIELLRTGQIVTSLIAALTFAMSAVPEEFPLVFTLYLSLGAWRLAKKRVLVKSLPSVEALGSADVLCTDKTGTLTEGRFQLTEIRPAVSGGEDTLAAAALMACEPRPVDSMEVAIFERLAGSLAALEGWSLVWDYPFETQGKHMTHVWRDARSGLNRTVMKGAVEGVLEHCDTSAHERAAIQRIVEEYAAQGSRLLGVALGEGTANGDRAHDERNLRWVGVLVFSDPIRGSALRAIGQCQAAGIEIKMLTGDHPLTAHYVADQVGIKHSHDRLFTGTDLQKMGAAERRKAYLEGAIFSRVLPEQKYEMIRLLQEAGRVVAMVGDGINDAPALRLSDIGISMGREATDVARSAAHLVLLESDFSGIVAAMLEGRRILSNLMRSFSYLIAFHVPVVLLSLIPPFLGWIPLLMPVHIIALELVVHPISAFTFENLLDSESKRERNPWRPLLSGALVSAGALILFRHLLEVASPETARSAALSAVLFGNIGFVANEVLPHPNRRFWITAAALLAVVGIVALKPFAALHLAPLALGQWVLALLVGATALLPRWSFLHFR
jgi:Ca2+-transporting ATPase